MDNNINSVPLPYHLILDARLNKISHPFYKRDLLKSQQLQSNSYYTTPAEYNYNNSNNNYNIPSQNYSHRQCHHQNHNNYSYINYYDYQNYQMPRYQRYYNKNQNHHNHNQNQEYYQDAYEYGQDAYECGQDEYQYGQDELYGYYDDQYQEYTQESEYFDEKNPENNIQYVLSDEAIEMFAKTEMKRMSKKNINTDSNNGNSKSKLVLNNIINPAEQSPIQRDK